MHQKKSKQTSLLAGEKHATFYTLVWARTFKPVNRQQWMKSTKSTGKMKKIKAKLNQLTLKNVLKVKDPKLSRVSIVQNNVYAAVHGTIGKDRLQETCSFHLGNHHTVILTYSYGWAEDSGWLRTLHCSRYLIYAHPCVNKDFVRSGSIGLI